MLIILLFFLNKPFIPSQATTDIKIIETKYRRPIPVPVPVYYHRFPPPAPYMDLAGNYYPEDNPYL